MVYNDLLRALEAQFDLQEHDATKYLAMVDSRLNAEIFSDRDIHTTTLAQGTSLVEESISFFPLPENWRKARRVTINGVQGEYVEPRQYKAISEYDCGNYYTIIGRVIRALPGSEIEVEYYATIGPLENNTYSWILGFYPGVYVAGCDYEAAIYLYEDQRIQIFKQRYDEEFARLMNLVDEESSGVGAQLVMRAV